MTGGPVAAGQLWFQCLILIFNSAVKNGVEKRLVTKVITRHLHDMALCTVSGANMNS
jgi:hypothetical protein